MKRILLLDDDEDLCMLMLSIFEELGVDTSIVINNFNQLKNLDLPTIDLAFLDINLGPGAETGIDAYDYLIAQGFHGKTIFFTGHARNYPLLQSRLNQRDVDVLEKPAELKSIENIIKGLAS